DGSLPSSIFFVLVLKILPPQTVRSKADATSLPDDSLQSRCLTLAVSRRRKRERRRSGRCRRSAPLQCSAIPPRRKRFCSHSSQANLNHVLNGVMGSRVLSTTRRPLASAVWGVSRPYMRRTNVPVSH